MRAVRHVPGALQSFIERAAHLYEGGKPDAFRAVCCEFQALSVHADAEVGALIEVELAAMLSEPYSYSDGWDTNQILIEVNSRFSLGISILLSSPPHLLNTVSDAVYMILGRNSFNYELFHFPVAQQHEVFDPCAIPTFSQRRVAHPTETVRLRAGTDIISWEIDQPVVLLRFIAAPTETVQWVYKKASLRPMFLASIDPGATQLSALCSYMAAIQYAPALDHIRPLLEHRNHQVRWQAAKTLWNLDHRAGHDALIRCLDDTHPHVRNAAERTKKKLADYLSAGGTQNGTYG